MRTEMFATKFSTFLRCWIGSGAKYIVSPSLVRAVIFPSFRTITVYIVIPHHCFTCCTFYELRATLLFAQCCIFSSNLMLFIIAAPSRGSVGCALKKATCLLSLLNRNIIEMQQAFNFFSDEINFLPFDVDCPVSTASRNTLLYSIHNLCWLPFVKCALAVCSSLAIECFRSHLPRCCFHPLDLILSIWREEGPVPPG